jgi:hypothetical protein
LAYHGAADLDASLFKTAAHLISQAAARTGCRMTLYSSLQYFEDLEEIRRYAAMGRLGVERYVGLSS